MKSSQSGNAIKTFVSLRIMGEKLDPTEITDLLKIVPTVAYAKGEQYFAGERTGYLKGKTGVWVFSTDREISSTNFADHLHAVVTVLALDHFDEFFQEKKIPKEKSSSLTPLPEFLLQGRLKKLRTLLKRKALAASLTCLWYGKAGAHPPSIPRLVSELFEWVPITIETDFSTDEESRPTATVRASA